MIAAAVLFALALGAFVYSLLPAKRRLVRGIGAGVFAVLVAGNFVHALEIYGQAKPVWTEWRSLKDVDVLAYRLIEDEAIYVWALRPETTAPIAYALPWSMENAKELRAAEQAAEEMGSPSVRVGGGFYERSLDGREPMFYPAPVPAAPTKDAS